MIKINTGILKEQLNRSKELMGIITEQFDTLETLDVNDVFEADINSRGNRPGYIKGKVISEELNRMNKKRGMMLSLKVNIVEVYQAPSTLIKGNYTMKIIVGDASGGILINPKTLENFKLDSIHKETKETKETKDWTGTTQGEETGGKLRKLKKFAKKIMRESNLNEHFGTLETFKLDSMEEDISRDKIIEILNEIYELQLEKAPEIAQRRLEELFEKIGIGYWSYPSPDKMGESRGKQGEEINERKKPKRKVEDTKYTKWCKDHGWEHGVGQGCADDALDSEDYHMRSWAIGFIAGMNESTINEHKVEEINEVTSLPAFNVDNGLLNIDNKRYKLQSEKAWTRWDIDIEDIDVEGNGDVNLTVKHPISGKSITSQIRKVNFDKVISGAKNNEKEIVVNNLEGKEFFLVRV